MTKIVIASLAIMITAFVSGCVQDDARLAQFVQQTKSESISDRVEGFKLISQYWDEANGAGIGFSDTPREHPESKRQQRVLSDRDLDSVAAAIEKGIGDIDSEVRKAAAIALVGIPRSSDSVVAAVLAGIKSDDASVNWYVVQQATNVWPEISLVIDYLIDDLSDSDTSKHYAAGDLLSYFGDRARPYSKRIAQAIFGGNLRENDRITNLYVLSDIGLTPDAVEIVMANASNLTAEQSSIVALAILEYPEALQELSTLHPGLVQSMEVHSTRLFPFLCKHPERDNKTRKWLMSQESIPANIMGMLGERRFVQEIEKLEDKASQHHRTFLAACKRACGDKAEVVIEASAQSPVEFRPASAWPQSDDSRRSKKSFGHGDGFTSVMVTGEILGRDGEHPNKVDFFRTNDSMLLGSNQNRKESVMYDAKTGRFVYLTNVFAAYSMGDDPFEPGPYQTGSAQVRIESAGFKPLVVQFFDEIPDVRIYLDKE